MTRDLDLCPFDHKINEYPKLTVEHFYVKFGDPSCIGFFKYQRKNRHRQTEVKFIGVSRFYTFVETFTNIIVTFQCFQGFCFYLNAFTSLQQKGSERLVTEIMSAERKSERSEPKMKQERKRSA